MKIVVNTNYKNHSGKLCVEQIGPKLAKAGHSVIYNDWNHYEEYDLALFVAPDSDVRRAKRKNPNILAVIIDPKSDIRRKRREAKCSDFLFVTSMEQRDFFLKYNKNVSIYLHFPDIKEMPKTHFKKHKIIIGYHGNKVHLNCMTDLSKVLDCLSDKYNIEFWAMYNIEKLGKWRINVPKKCPVRHIQWSEDNYYKYLSQSDIGVVPAKIPMNTIIDRILVRFLSSFLINWPSYDKHDYLIRFKYSTNPGRIYQFSQFHIPVVAEFLPSYCQMIQNGSSGFLAYSREGWYDALEKLILNPDLRNKMSRNLKNFIDNHYSPEINFRKFNKKLNSLNKL